MMPGNQNVLSGNLDLILVAQKGNAFHNECETM